MNASEPKSEKDLAIHELIAILGFCHERPGAAVFSERMEGASAARAEIRAEIRSRIKALMREGSE